MNFDSRGTTAGSGENFSLRRERRTQSGRSKARRTGAVGSKMRPRTWQRVEVGDRGCVGQAPCVAGGRCTTRFENTHGTDFREPVYRWHPWSGLQVCIHEAIDKSGGIVFRGSLSGADADRCLESRRGCSSARSARACAWPKPTSSCRHLRLQPNFSCFGNHPDLES